MPSRKSRPSMESMKTITVVEIDSEGNASARGQRILAEYSFLRSFEWFYKNESQSGSRYLFELTRINLFTWSVAFRGRELLTASVEFCPLSCAIWTFERPDGEAQRLSECCTVGECLAHEAKAPLRLEDWTRPSR